LQQGSKASKPQTMQDVYSKEYTVKDEHIDFQGIMDGLHYPYYLEECRHQFMVDVLGYDLKVASEAGTNVVLSQFGLKFRRSLMKGQKFTVTCSAHPDKSGKPQFHLKQEILRDGKLVTEAVFTATCVKTTGGRSFVPEEIAAAVSKGEPLDGVTFH
jgi:acyl-CoA thioester hydrolase